jgi:hypothetical protein
VDGHALAERQVADRGGVGPGDDEPVVSALHLEAPRPEGGGEPLRAGALHLDGAAAAGDELVDRAVRDHAAAGDNDHRVGGLRHLGEHVTRHQHGPALRREPAHEVAQPADPLRIEPVGGLVQDQDPGIAEQGRGEREPLAHAERVLADPAARRVLKRHDLDRLVGARLRNSRRAGHRAKVVAGAAARMEAGALQHGPDRAKRLGERPVGLALDRRRAARRLGEAENHPQRGGLPGAVRPEKARDPAGLDVEADAIDGPHGPEALAQVADLDLGHGRVVPGGGKQSTARRRRAG